MKTTLGLLCECQENTFTMVGGVVHSRDDVVQVIEGFGGLQKFVDSIDAMDKDTEIYGVYNLILKAYHKFKREMYHDLYCKYYGGSYENDISS